MELFRLSSHLERLWRWLFIEVWVEEITDVAADCDGKFLQDRYSAVFHTPFDAGHISPIDTCLMGKRLLG